MKKLLVILSLGLALLVWAVSPVFSEKPTNYTEWDYPSVEIVLKPNVVFNTEGVLQYRAWGAYMVGSVLTEDGGSRRLETTVYFGDLQNEPFTDAQLKAHLPGGQLKQAWTDFCEEALGEDLG